MMKIAGALMIIAASSGVGLFYSQSMKQRTINLELICKMLRVCAAEIEYSAKTLPEIIRGLADDEAFSQLDFLQLCVHNLRNGMSFGKAWAASIEKSRTNLSKQDLSLLLDFGTGAGFSDCSAELNRCKLFITRFSKQIEEAQADSATKGELYKKLAPLIGAFIAVIII